MEINIWFTIFVCWPQPLPPMYLMFVPIHWNRGITSSNVFLSPPTMIDSLPSRAPISPPDTTDYTLDCWITRSIQSSNALAFSYRVNLAGQRGLAGCHIDEDSALLETIQNSLLTQYHFAHILRISIIKLSVHLYPTMLNTTSHSFPTSIGLFTTLAPFFAKSSHLLKVRLY